MINILNLLFNRIIIGVIVILIATIILKFIDLYLGNKSKFSREFIIDAIFNGDPYYFTMIRSLNKHPNAKFIVYYLFLILILPAIYLKLIEDFYIVVSATFSVYLIILFFWYVPQYFKCRRERGNNDLRQVNIRLKRLRLNYILNNISSHYLVILNIITIFYLISSVGKTIDYTYTFDDILLLLFLINTFISLFLGTDNCLISPYLVFKFLL